MSEETTRQFLARLWELQTEHGLTNAALARLLGCSPSYLPHLKAGRKGKRIGLNLALRAAQRFPELHALLLADFPVSTENVPPGNDSDEGVKP